MTTISNVPLVTVGARDPLVLRVRERLNVPGGDTLDQPLVEIIRGMQIARGLDATGEITYRTLSLLDLSAF